MKSYYIVNGIELVNNDKDNTVCYRSENEKGEKRTTVLFFSTDNQDRVNYIENIKEEKIYQVIKKCVLRLNHYLKIIWEIMMKIKK